MTAGDLPAVQPLLAQLGYDVEPEEVQRRFAAVNTIDTHALLVVEFERRVVGFVHVFARPALEKKPEAVVQSLVVDTSCRGGGIGKVLMDVAERWAKERGFDSVTLTSQTMREDAHAFYEHLGYGKAATSYLLRKQFGDESGDGK